MSVFPETAAEAAPQAAGYLFQLRYALYRALKKIPRDPTGTIAVERVDDFAVADANELREVGQLKHSTDPKIIFNDSSPPIWRTIGNWSRLLVKSHDLNLATLELVFVTTASVAKASSISLLGPAEDDRDPAAALNKLTETALKSENQSTQKDRADFLGLDPPVQAALVRAIRIIDNSPNLSALADEIEDLLHYACEPASRTEFRSEVEGWWFDRIANGFSKGEGVIIPLIELESRISYLREKYKVSSLQIDVESSPETPDNLDTYLFAKQVRLVKANDRRVRNAQRDFLRASAQRSKWLREARLDPVEFDQYDQALEEKWGAQSALVWDELSENSSNDEKCKAGRELLGWAETQERPLRGASAQFLTSGSYHTLADRMRLGWHPEYQKLFEV